MTELDALSRALLSAAAGCHEPSLADRARLRQRLIARLGVAAGFGALGAAATQTSPAVAATAGGAFAKSSLAATLFGSAKLYAIGKVVGLAVAVSAAGISGYDWFASTANPSVQPADVAGTARATAPRVRTNAAAKTANPTPSGSTETEAKPVRGSERTDTPPARAADRALGTPAALRERPPGPSDVPALPPVASFPSDVPSLAAEARGLAHAQAALREGNPAQALSLLDQQKAQFTDGSLEEERSAARVFALCKVGRVHEANAAAADFLRRSPRSVLAERVANACPQAK